MCWYTDGGKREQKPKERKGGVLTQKTNDEEKKQDKGTKAETKGVGETEERPSS